MESIVVTFGAISSAVTFVVTWLKSLLLQIPAYAALENQQQALITQGIAFVAGIVIAISTQANILAVFPQFDTTPAILGYIVTGLACGGGSQLFYSILALLSGKVLLPPPSAQIVEGKAMKVRSEYIPYS